MIPEVAKKKHVYVLDWFGFGKGVRDLEEGPTFELMQEHLREFMDVQGIERADILGRSMGGWIAAQFAHQSPSLFERLIMLCAAGMNLAPAGGIGFAKLPSVDDLRAMFIKSMLKGEQADPAIVEAVVVTAHRMITAPGAMSGIEPLLYQMEVPSMIDRYMLQRRLPTSRTDADVVGRGGRVRSVPYLARRRKTGGSNHAAPGFRHAIAGWPARRIVYPPSRLGNTSPILSLNTASAIRSNEVGCALTMISFALADFAAGTAPAIG